MNTRFRLFLCACLSCIAVGCRQDPYFEAYVETLNAEKRALEDQINELEFDYEALCQELQQCRQGRDRAATPSLRTPSPTRRAPAQPDADEDPDKLDLEPPTIDPGTPTA